MASARADARGVDGVHAADHRERVAAEAEAPDAIERALGRAMRVVVGGGVERHYARRAVLRPRQDLAAEDARVDVRSGEHDFARGAAAKSSGGDERQRLADHLRTHGVAKDVDTWSG